MRQIARFELAGMRDSELRGLLRQVFNELVKSDPGSHERRNALASIETIQHELNSRALHL